jgi:hypothetical protein
MIAAYTALHYGSPYLEWAMRSVLPFVDKYYILYSAQGSHGTRANGKTLPPTDNRDNLQWIASQAAGHKLVWIDGDWRQEGQQRDSIYQYTQAMDLILVVDYDEIWTEAGVDQAIKWAAGAGSKQYRIPMVHFWRSFRRAVLHDPAYPIRILKPSGAGECTLHVAPIAHMGYAIPDWLMRYKWHIHGHRAQLRTDIDWFKERWGNNAQQDCHPVGSDFWNPETVQPFDYLPDWMAGHKYYHHEVIA